MLQDVGSAFHETLGRLCLLLVGFHAALSTLLHAFVVVQNVLDTHLQCFRSVRVLQHLLDRYQQFLGFLSAERFYTFLIEMESNNHRHDGTQQQEPPALPEIRGNDNLDADGLPIFSYILDILHLEDVGARLQTGKPHCMFTGLQCYPLVLKAFQPVDVLLLLAGIPQRRETQRERLVGLVQCDSLG